MLSDGGEMRDASNMRCPARTCVLYISDAGGPTLVLEHRPGEPWGDEVRCFACWPAAGRILSFPGTMLHGIVAEPTCADGGNNIAVTFAERVAVALTVAVAVCASRCGVPVGVAIALPHCHCRSSCPLQGSGKPS